MPRGLKAWAIWLSVQAVVTTALTFAWRVIIKLAEHAMVGWADDQIAAVFGLASPTLRAVASWAFPIVLAVITLFVFYRFILWQHQLAGAIEDPVASPSAPPSRARIASPPRAPVIEGHQPMATDPTETTTPKPPPNWNRLFAIADDKKSVWLQFLPDNKNYKSDTLLLIIYGHKVLLGNTRVHVNAAHIAVSKTISNAPNKPNRTFNQWILGPMAALQDEDYFADQVGSYLKRVALSQGGMYELTPDGEVRARSIAYDLISRAD